MTETTELIILNFTKFQENAIILHTLSRNYGRRSFFVKSGKKANMSMFLPLNIVEADIVINPKTDLWTARNFYSLHPLIGIRNNIYKNSMTMFMSEVLFKLMREGELEEEFYLWAKKQIILLDAINDDFSNFHIRFLLELAVQLGFRPTWEDIEPFVTEETNEIKEFMNASFEDSMLITLKGETRNKLCERILAYIEFHTEISFNIKSLAVLREIYA